MPVVGRWVPTTSPRDHPFLMSVKPLEKPLYQCINTLSLIYSPLPCYCCSRPFVSPVLPRGTGYQGLSSQD
jgi:hypothetical protein